LSEAGTCRQSSTNAQADAVREVEACAIRAAMAQGGGHPLDHRSVDGRRGIGRDDPRYAAHLRLAGRCPAVAARRPVLASVMAAATGRRQGSSGRNGTSLPPTPQHRAVRTPERPGLRYRPLPILPRPSSPGRPAAAGPDRPDPGRRG
jgi:hypothetical protein